MASSTQVQTLTKGFVHDGLPWWMVIVRAAQFLLSLITIGLIGYVISLQNEISLSDFASLTLFTAIFTMLIVAYVTIAPKMVREGYHIIAECVLEGLLVVFWLTSFAGLAHWVDELHQLGADDFSIPQEYCQFDESACHELSHIKTALGCAKGATVFGAFLFVMSAVDLGFIIATLVRASKEGNGNVASSSAPVAQHADPEMGYHPNPVAQPQPAAHTPPAGYGAPVMHQSYQNSQGVTDVSM